MGRSRQKYQRVSIYSLRPSVLATCIRKEEKSYLHCGRRLGVARTLDRNVICTLAQTLGEFDSEEHSS